MKKLWYVALASLILLLGACSVKDKKEDKVSKGEQVEVEFWYGLGSEAHKKMQSIIKQYNDSQNEYVVKGVSQASYTETFQKLQSAIASGEAPGVVIAQADTIHNLAQKEALTDLTSFVEADQDVNTDDFLPVFMENAQMDNKLYALPAYGTTQVMYYRKDLIEAQNMKPEEIFSTWENVAAASKQIQATNKVEFGHLPMWGNGNLIDLARSSGGQILNEDGTKVVIDSDEWVQSWDFIRKQIHEEKTMKVNSGGQGWEYWYRTIDDVMNGKAMSYTGSSGDKGNLDFTKIGSIPQPGFNGHDAKPMISTLYMTSPAIVSDEVKAGAYDFMKFFSSAEVNADWAQNIGYIPVKQSAMEVPEYKAFLADNPAYAVPFEQAQFGLPDFIDPTNGKIMDALAIAADEVELQNIDAKTALTKAQKAAQEALDKVDK